MYHAEAVVNAALAPLVGVEFGSIRVIGATGALTTDPEGQPIVLVTLIVSDPANEEGRWSLEEVDALQQEAQRLLAERDPELPYAVIELLPETPEPDDDAAATDPELAEGLDSDASR